MIQLTGVRVYQYNNMYYGRQEATK